MSVAPDSGESRAGAGLGSGTVAVAVTRVRGPSALATNAQLSPALTGDSRTNSRPDDSHHSRPNSNAGHHGSNKVGDVSELGAEPIQPNFRPLGLRIRKVSQLHPPASQRSHQRSRSMMPLTINTQIAAAASGAVPIAASATAAASTPAGGDAEPLSAPAIDNPALSHVSPSSGGEKKRRHRSRDPSDAVGNTPPGLNVDAPVSPSAGASPISPKDRHHRKNKSSHFRKNSKSHLNLTGVGPGPNGGTGVPNRVWRADSSKLTFEQLAKLQTTPCYFADADLAATNLPDVWIHYDVNDNGILDPKEVAALASDIVDRFVLLYRDQLQQEQPPGPKSDAIIERALRRDIFPHMLAGNSMSEAKKLMQERLTKELDLDRDGSITRTEFMYQWKHTSKNILTLNPPKQAIKCVIL